MFTYLTKYLHMWLPSKYMLGQINCKYGVYLSDICLAKYLQIRWLPGKYMFGQKFSILVVTWQVFSGKIFALNFLSCLLIYFKVEAIRQYVLPDIRLSGSSHILSATGRFATWILKCMLYTKHWHKYLNNAYICRVSWITGLILET